MKIVDIDPEKCTGCGLCARICPLQILYIDKESKLCKVTDENKCDRLGGCQMICPTNAIVIN